jgi:signal transduction histidine kinase
MLFFAITSLISAFASLFFAFYIYSRKKKGVFNIVWYLGCLGFFFYFIFYFIWGIQIEYEPALFWARMLNITVLLFPIYYLQWGFLFLKRNKENKNRVILAFGYIITFLFLPFTFSKYFIKGVGAISFFNFFPQAGWLYFVFIIYFSFSMSYLLYVFYKEIGYASGFYREQIRYALLASILANAGGITNYPLMFGLDTFAPIGNPFLILMPLFLAYSATEHRLFNLNILLRRLILYLTSLSLSILIALSARLILNLFFKSTGYLGDIIVLTVSLYLFLPFKNYFSRLANKYFLSPLYNSREIISVLSDQLKTILEIKKVYNTIAAALTKYFSAKAVGILIYHEKAGRFSVQYNQGFNLKEGEKINLSQTIQDLYFSQNKIVIAEELKNTSYLEYRKFIEGAAALGIEILIPLNLKNKNIGVLILGSKETGDIYNKEDLEIFAVISAQAAIAMENALLYEETKGFNIKLKKEVEKATHDLVIANEQLKKLDAAKSDFISIASHQLRTPLTAIKGYISMILEGDFGKLTDNEKVSLEKVFDSNERLIHLVEDLLNVSRIESGKIQYNLSDTQLEKTVASVVDELSNNAKKKELKLIYHNPAKPLAKLNIDEEKIRQVIMNLIDNAIKYTKKGQIKVAIRQTEHNILFSVADTGMGIRKEDQANLFKKFSRGTGTSLVHTEGTGLGLYVAREMIGAHQGKIWAESEGENKGTKFSFKLPLASKQISDNKQINTKLMN